MLDPCPQAKGGDTQLMLEQIACLEGRLNELREMNNLLLKTILEIKSDTEKAVGALSYDVFGPAKAVRTFPAEKLAVTFAHSGNGATRLAFDCVRPITAGPGETVIGGTLSNEIRLDSRNVNEFGGNPRGCAKAPHCDSAGEFCTVASRAPGCIVNTAWYDWYTSTQRKKNLSVDQTELCSS